MSTAALDLIIELKGNADKQMKSLAGEVDNVGKHAGLMQSALGTALGVIGGGAVLGAASAGFHALSGFITTGIADARDANVVFAQTQAVIKSTGGAAGVSAQQVADMASSLSAASGKSLFGDDDIQKGENMLLTFTNIKGVLPDATKVMVDMATAMHTDAAGGAVQLGKALQDPIKGVAALGRVGVTFTAQQQKQIETMQKAGDMAGAQRVILAELNKEFGGSAEAAAKADGGWAQFSDRMGELGESIGHQLEPVTQAFFGFMAGPGATAIETVTGMLAGGLTSAISFLTGTVLPPLIDIMGDVVDGFSEGGVLGAIDNFLGRLGDMVPALQPVTAALTTFADWLAASLPGAIATASAAFQTVAGLIGGNLQPVLVGVATAIAAVVVPAFLAWAVAAVTSAAATIAALAPVVLPIVAIGVAAGVLYAAWQSNFGGIRDTLTAFWTGTGQPIFAALQTWLSSTLTAAIATLAGFWTGTLQPALAAVWAFIQGSVIPTLGTLASNTIPIVVSAAQSLAAFWTGTLQPALSAVWGFIQGSVIPILSSLASDALPIVTTAARDLATLWTGTLQPALSAVWSFIQGSVIPLFDALANVAIAAVKLAVTVLAGVWQNVLQPALSAIWGFIQSSLIPLLDALANVALAAVKLAVTVLAGVWQNVLHPALSAVWSFIQNSLMPVFTAVAGVISKTLQPVLSAVAGVLNTAVGPALSGAASFASTLSRALGGVSGVISSVIGWLNRLASTLSSLPGHLPSWMTPHSPTPLEYGLRSISDAMRTLARADVPALGRAFDSLAAPSLGITSPSLALPARSTVGMQTVSAASSAGSSFAWHGDLIIQQQPGEDATALANRVVGIIDQRSRTRR
jgi:hypothetical protein